MTTGFEVVCVKKVETRVFMDHKLIIMTQQYDAAVKKVNATPVYINRDINRSCNIALFCFGHASLGSLGLDLAQFKNIKLECVQKSHQEGKTFGNQSL